MKKLNEFIVESQPKSYMNHIWETIYNKFSDMMTNKMGIEISDENSGYTCCRHINDTKKFPKDCEILNNGIYAISIPTDMKSPQDLRTVELLIHKAKKFGLIYTYINYDVYIINPVFYNWFKPIYDAGKNDEKLTSTQKKYYNMYAEEFEKFLY